MTQITNGTVKYERTVKTGDFENKKFSAELSFTIPEDGNPATSLSLVAGMAETQVLATLGLQAGAHAAPSANAPKAPAKGKAAAPAPKPAPAPAPAADASVVDDTDPLTDRAPMPPKSKAAAAAVVDENDLGDILGEAPKEITDKELNDAVSKQQAAVKNAPAIRNLIAAMGVKMPPGRVIDIPQAKRQEFLDKLKEVKSIV